MDVVTCSSTAVWGASTYLATKTSPKKKAQIAQTKTTAFTVPSVTRRLCFFFC